MDKKYVSLNWDIVTRWDYFAKNTVGQQFVTSVDSISAKLAEGFGRYHKKDKIRFYRYSFGSVKEALDWNEKSKVRKLVKPEEYHLIYQQLSLLPKEINGLIKLTDQKLRK